MVRADKIARVEAVLAGRQPDRPPVSLWYHFESHQRNGRAALNAHLDLMRTYDLDFLKVMNDNGYPCRAMIQSVADLNSLDVLHGDEPEFAQQLTLLELLIREVKDKLLMTTTVFNAWATLRKLVKPGGGSAPPRMDMSGDVGGAILERLMAEDRSAVARALGVIGESLANFAKLCLEAGADGIFMSVRDDWVDTPANGPGTYDDIVKPADLVVLDAAREGRFNMLHVCGVAKDFERFAEYPVQVLNWADRAAGPSIAEVKNRLKPAICGGVDNLGTLSDGQPADCIAEVHDALAQAGERPIIIAPGCTFAPESVPTANLHAVCHAARET